MRAKDHIYKSDSLAKGLEGLSLAITAGLRAGRHGVRGNSKSNTWLWKDRAIKFMTKDLEVVE